MQRILLFVIVLFVAWKILAAWGKRLSKRGAGAEDFSRFSVRSRDRRRRMNEQRRETVRELVACSRCGTHIPADRAVMNTAGLPCCSSDCAAEDSAGAGRRT